MPVCAGAGRSRYPEAELAELAAFREVCRAAGVRFGIGLSPFELHLHPERGWQDRLAAKLAELAQLKPDDLAILFDDMRGDVPDLAERQAAIVHFAAERGIAERILCCPSYYSDDPILDVAFGAAAAFLSRAIGAPARSGDPHLLDRRGGVQPRISPPAISPASPGSCGRKPILWDNYPVNDGARMSQHLHLRALHRPPGGDRRPDRRARRQPGLAAPAEPHARC